MTRLTIPTSPLSKIAFGNALCAIRSASNDHSEALQWRHPAPEGAALTARLKTAEKLAAPAKSLPQALKRGPIFSDLAARVELVPFPNRLEAEFFRNL
jgi:hypothetical protein